MRCYSQQEYLRWTSMDNKSINQHPVGSTENSFSRRFLLHSMGLSSLSWVLPGCGGGGTGGAGDNASPATVAGGGTGVSTQSAHVSALYSAADFERMRAQVNAGIAPWSTGWNALTNSGRSQLGRTPTPLAEVIRGGAGENYHVMVEDMQRAYQFALRWQVSGDVNYANAAVQYLDAWSSTLTSLSGNADRFLAAGLYGYQWALAGELMRTYPGWSSSGIAALQAMLLTHFYPKCHDFLITHNGSNITNYWANWDLISLCGIAFIGVFCQRKDLYDEALSYYYQGRGNGAADHSVYCIHPGLLGQWQEQARDNGHSSLGIALNALICELAWQQGDDLYGYRNNRFLAGAEYVAKCQLTPIGNNSTIPFSLYINRQGTFTEASTSGRPNNRAAWEAIYNHYVNRKGLSAPNVTTLAANLRPETNEWVGDIPSFGTLTFSRPAITAAVAPSGLRAYATHAAVLLSWWGSALATSYLVQRSTSANGSFTDVASLGSTELLTYIDTPGPGIWHYRVCTVYNGQTLVGTDRARVALASELHLNIPLNQSSGSSATDSTSYARHGSLQGGASWVAGRSGNALALDGSTGYLVLPTGVMEDLWDCTVAMWVYWNSASTNTRIFDFGSSDISYMCLIPKDSGGIMRFSVTGTSYFGEQTIAHTAALPTGSWTHVAVTLQGKLGTLYVNGVSVGSNAAMDLAPFQLGATRQNWLGRSQYSADPYFNGKLQDVRIYSGALNASEIAALAA